MTTEVHEQTETFQDLCKELGQRVNSTENALLCFRAYETYLAENPGTAHGMANKSDRDPSTPSFRKAAAEASGVAAATIDALLQVGKAIAPLSEQTKEALTASSLGNWMRALRKLATSDFEGKREQIITDFASQVEADATSARKNLMKTLGMAPKARESVIAREVDRKVGELAQGEDLELRFNGYIVRVEIGGQAGGRIHVTAVAYQGEKKEVEKLLKDEKESEDTGQAEVMVMPSPQPDTQAA